MKILFDTIEARLLPYPRKDGKPIKGLTAHLVVLNVVQESPPEYDADTEVLEEVSTVDVPARECRKSWVARPKPPREWPTVTEFWQEFTAEEKLAIINSTDAQVKLLYSDMSHWSYNFRADDSRVVMGLDLLISVGILTAERKDVILGA